MNKQFSWSQFFEAKQNRKGKMIVKLKNNVNSSNEKMFRKKIPRFCLNDDRCVRFSSYSKAILPYMNLEDGLRDKMWYGPSDIKLFKNKIKMDVISFRNQLKMLKKGTCGATEIKLIYMRGLEQRFDTKRKMRRRMAIQAVLNAQKRLKSSAWSVKEFYLADISKKFSTAAKSQALLDGLADERNAQL